MLLRDKGNFLFPSGHINGLHFFTERQIKKPTKAKPIGSHAVGIHINHITQHLSESSPISLECVKSNLGTSEFIPIDGRWVVERTFAWLENYRRVCRNYEKLLKVARHMAVTACVCIMLKYFR